MPGPITQSTGERLAVALRKVKDPIHDQIELTPTLSSIIDTRQFQRLREIKQLGTTYYVWPGASHNRFEHCLGVAHLARLLVTHLKKSQPELEITDRDVQCVEIAGACHDLGHGPWSHVFDNLFIPKASKGTSTWKHEQGSETMFDYLVKENYIEGLSSNEKDQEFIKALIAGDHDRCKDEKRFLFDIVANKTNGLDVDKFDYIARDSHNTGESVNINIRRLLQSARVIKDQICYDIKDVNNIYEICGTRFRLHKMVYNHKTAKAIEYMIVDALLLADPYLNIAASVNNAEEYLYLTDSIMHTIEKSKDPNLKPSQDLLYRIRRRELYRQVDYRVIEWRDRDIFRRRVTPESIVASAKEKFRNDPAALKKLEGTVDLDIEELTADDVVVDFSTMHYGMREENPLHHIMFYSKAKPYECAKVQPGDCSGLHPSVFAEDMLQVFTKKPEYIFVVQTGYRAVLDTIDLLQIPIQPTSSVETLPTISTPSTPGPSAHAARVTSLGSAVTLTGTVAHKLSHNTFTTLDPSSVRSPKMPLSAGASVNTPGRPGKRGRGGEDEEKEKILPQLHDEPGSPSPKRPGKRPRGG